MIDTSVLIEYERGRLDLEHHLAGRQDEEFFLSVITATELLQGVLRARDAKAREQRRAFVEAVLERFPIVAVDLAIARIHSQLWADLAASGTMIGPNDLWLAATAISHGVSLVTNNLREFRRVPGLSVESWH